MFDLKSLLTKQQHLIFATLIFFFVVKTANLIHYKWNEFGVNYHFALKNISK
jgi:hypothetical protein